MLDTFKEYYLIDQKDTAACRGRGGEAQLRNLCEIHVYNIYYVETYFDLVVQFH